LRALISGATGFVGPYLYEHLLAQGDEVAAFAYGTPKALPASVVSLDVDIRTIADVQHAVENAQPEAVYHLAAVSSIAAARLNPRLTVEINVAGTYNLFEAAMRLPKPPRILNVSTAQVYSTEVDEVTESSPVCPVNPYAASKAMAEQVPALFPDADYVTVRSFNHSGPGQTTDFVLASFTAQVVEMEAGRRLPVLEVGDIEVERDFLDVRDVVRAYRLLIERGRRGQVYNVASGTTYSIGSILETLQGLTHVKFDVQIDPSRRRPGQRQRIAADTAKLKADTGWQPTITLNTMLRDLLNYWRAAQDKATTSSYRAGPYGS
jgi:GDP-4-dehydro-6-deoxy-D-mannose reductase